MSEHVNPADLNRLYAAEFADSAAAFALLEHPAGEGVLDWLATEELTGASSEIYEQQLADARTRFENAMTFSLAKGKTDKDGIMKRVQPYEAVDDDGSVHTVSLIQLDTGSASHPYTLYKVFTERVSIDEQAGTQTEYRREFWYISGSQYRHIQNGLEPKEEYFIVRPKAGGPGSLTRPQQETPELTLLNQLTRLVQQSPAHQEQKQGLGHTVLRRITRKKRDDK